MRLKKLRRARTDRDVGQPYCFDFRRVHGHAVLGDKVAQVLHPTLHERAFGALEEQAVVVQSGRDDPDVLQVLGEGGAIDQNVVEEHEHKATQEGAQNLIHERLERHRGVRQAEGHDHELKVAVMSSKCRLVNVSIVHSDLVIAAAKVKLGEVGGAVELVQKFVDNGNGEHIAHCLGVDSAIVDAESPRAILLAPRRIGDENAKCWGRMRPCCSISAHWRSSSSLSSWG
ncbi:hypothetical protein SEVIR_8G040866v4 [Setaria viridis]